MGKRTVEKADSEKGLFADAQSLKQSSLRCGARFVGAAEGGCSSRAAGLAPQRPFSSRDSTVFGPLYESLTFPCNIMRL